MLVWWELMAWTVFWAITAGALFVALFWIADQRRVRRLLRAWDRAQEEQRRHDAAVVHIKARAGWYRSQEGGE